MVRTLLETPIYMGKTHGLVFVDKTQQWMYSRRDACTSQQQLAVGNLLPCLCLWDKSRALRGDFRVNITFPILFWGQSGARRGYNTKCSCWLSPASVQKVKFNDMGESTAGPRVELEGLTASPHGPLLQAVLQVFLLPGKVGAVLYTGGLGSVFKQMTKQCSSQKSSSLTLQLSAHTFKF